MNNYSKRNLILFVSLLISLLSFASTHEIEDKKIKSSGFFASKWVEMVEVNEQIELSASMGNSISLPKYEKVLVEQPTIMQSVGDRMKLSDSTTSENLATLLQQEKEINELSNKLGIEISSPDDLPLYREVATWIGTRYRMGAMNRNAVDCSGFTNIIYNTVYNQKIPRVSIDIASKVAKSLPLKDLIPGDLVFFATRAKHRINHVGIYIGNGNFIHASIKGVKVSSLLEGYYKNALRKAGRIEQ